MRSLLIVAALSLAGCGAAGRLPGGALGPAAAAGVVSAGGVGSLDQAAMDCVVRNTTPDRLQPILGVEDRGIQDRLLAPILQESSVQDCIVATAALDAAGL